MSNGFFRELESILDNEWIVIADACALFAGWCPLDSYTSNYGAPDENRRYKRIANGKEETPSKDDFLEMRFFHGKWGKSDYQVPTRHPYINYGDIVSSEVSVRDAFKVGLGFRDERIDNLFDAATEEGILPDNLLQVVHFDHHHVSIGVTATGEVGEIPKPKFVVNEKKKPRKEITRIQVRFFKILRDNGNVIPEPYDFFMWLATNKDTSPFIKITEVTVNYAYYYDKKATNAERRLKHDTELVQETINRYCKAIKTKSS